MGETRDGLGTLPRELVTLRFICHRLAEALAKRCLADANRDREAPNDWPAGQEWKDLVGTSHSIFRHRAWEEAGLDTDKMRHLLFASGWPRDFEDALSVAAPPSRGTAEPEPDEVDETLRARLWRRGAAETETTNGIMRN